MAYATVAQMIQRYDVKRLGQLVKDDGTQADSTALLTDTTLAAALNDATSLVTQAMIAGARYTQAELTTLASDATYQFGLVRITCDLCFGLLVARRGYSAQEMAAMAPRYADAMAQLELLRDGQRLFTITGHQDASAVERMVLSDNLSLISSASRYFGILSDGSGV